MILRNTIFYTLLTAILILPSFYLKAQVDESPKGSVYKVNMKVDLPLTIALFASNYVGFKYLNNKPGLSHDEIIGLNPDDIWWFDRVATQQNANDRFHYQDVSDYVMNATIALPLLLGFDKEIRKDWLDLLVLYGETHAFNSSIYLVSANFIDRTRPFLYNPDVPYGYKDETGTTVSFFSGHTSTTAAASFFMAKVYSDYHPELGNKKFWLFGAALIPPALVGFFRVKAMKHFPTDVIVGTAVGATVGIMIPQLHKVKQKTNISFIPYGGAVNGLRIQYTLK
jgi:membrane-associated phospholipid phosphatase